MNPPSARSGSVLTTPSRRLRRRLLIAVVTVVGLVLVGLLLRVTNADVAVSAAIHADRRGLLGAVAEAFYLSLKPLPAAFLMIVATAAGAVWTRSWITAIVFLGTIAVTWGSAEAIKLVVDRPRPGLSEATMEAIGTTADASFPSGHVAFTAAFVLACVYVLWGTRGRLSVIVIGVVLVASMAAAVVIVGVHYLGDAVASVFWVAGVFPAVRGVWVVLVTKVDAGMRRRRAHLAP